MLSGQRSCLAKHVFFLIVPQASPFVEGDNALKLWCHQELRQRLKACFFRNP